MFLIRLIQQIKNAGWTDILTGIDWGDLVGQAISCSLPGFICTCRAPFGEIGFMDIDLPWGVDTWEEGLSAICPATAFTKVGAAFATQGYWVQADLLDYLTLSEFGSWAILIYILAVMGGLISMATGQPPRNYMWFFLGPALYSWLLDTREPVTGVQWAVGRQLQNQAEVWKMAEIGIANTNMAKRLGAASQSFDGFSVGLAFTSTHPPIQVIPHMPNHPPGWAKVYVSSLFVWYDELVSSAVQWMVDWSGVTRQHSTLIDGVTSAFGIDIYNTNIPGTSNLASMFGAEVGRWYLLTDSKWGMLESITSARVRSPDLRDAFHTYFASECGDALKKNVNKGAFIMATTGSGENLPPSVFKIKEEGAGVIANIEEVAGIPVGRYNNYEGLRRDLRATAVPMPRSLKNFLDSRERGDFQKSVQWDEDWVFNWGSLVPVHASQIKNVMNKKRIRCDAYLELLIFALRWEAGHITHNLVEHAPDGINAGLIPGFILGLIEGMLPGVDPYPLGSAKAAAVVFNLFYGWDIDYGRNGFDPAGLLEGILDAIGAGGVVDGVRAQRFLSDMVLVHLIRNEFALAPQPVDIRYTGEQAVRNYSQMQVRELGSKNKFGELYTWALMIPYVQGVLLYFLAIMYPFACLMILMPGMHKSLITWMSFWAWAKLWDVGFAFVRSLERVIWATIGNSSESARIADRIAEMQGWGSVNVDTTCPDIAGIVKVHCIVPAVTLKDGAGGDLSTVGLDPWLDALSIFDRALTVGAHLDLDLANAYYIYIMAALYFAVPAVTGQLVLGAKAGASSLVSGALSGVSGEAGRAASTGHQGQMAYQASAAQQSIAQEAYAKAMRKPGDGGGPGLAMASLGWGNKGLSHKADANALGTYGGGMDIMQQQYFDGIRADQDGMNVLSSGASAAGQIGQTMRSRRGGGGGGGAAATTTGASRVNSNLGEASHDMHNAGEAANTASSAAQQAANWSSVAHDHQANMAEGLNAPVRPGGSSVSQMLGGAGGAVTGLLEYGAPIANLAAANARWKMTQAGAAAGSEFRQAKANANIDSFGASARSQGADMMAGRTGAHAQFDASMAAWEAKNAYAAQASGAASVLGLMAGGLAAGPKPTDMTGMAMAGQIDSYGVDDAGNSQAKHSAQMYANWASPDNKSGYGGRVDGWQGDLQGSVGGDAVARRLEMHSLGGLAKGALTSLVGSEDGTLRPAALGGDKSNPVGRGDQLSQRVADQGGRALGVSEFQPQYKESDPEVRSGDRKAGETRELVPGLSTKLTK